MSNRSRFMRKGKGKPTSNELSFRDQLALEIVRDKLRVYVDKYARIKGSTVTYSLYDYKSKKVTQKELSLAQCKTVVGELYG